CSSRRRHTIFSRDWSSDVCSSDLVSYRETVARATEVVGECNRLINGVPHVAAVRLRVEPFTPTGPLAASAPPVVVSVDPAHGLRSEERRVGKERRSRLSGPTGKCR